MTLSLIGIALLSHFFGDRANKRLKENNFKKNINILSGTKADWSCFYLAKQYHEECDDINRGNDYMEGLCFDLETKLSKCKDDLYDDISSFNSYYMEPPVKLIDAPSWFENKQN
ncbi:uncharacterized protein TA19230 [Theileria annulata]|uniref:Uncharacterized protein n=1 Tax=Theileria annulata TaxID=5874 RepID=Q4UGC1_THEAN|nr:uncharacterized protein TA19230 [Theileria annulata]CAI73868.1 hypothetical protein TA19230 [Theileria annulata]|eukprot:XP_954545.1 hypothetical protein TA19230 [Theileria annulata]